MWRKLELHSKISISYRFFLFDCNRHEHVTERLTKEDVSTTDARKIRKKVIVLPLVVRIVCL